MYWYKIWIIKHGQASYLRPQNEPNSQDVVERGRERKRLWNAENQVLTQVFELRIVISMGHKNFWKYEILWTVM